MVEGAGYHPGSLKFINPSTSEEPMKDSMELDDDEEGVWQGGYETGASEASSEMMLGIFSAMLERHYLSTLLHNLAEAYQGKPGHEEPFFRDLMELHAKVRAKDYEGTVTKYRMSLDKGTTHATATLEFAGWTEGDGSGHEGYNWLDYFDHDGTYIGPDEYGIEPLFWVVQ